MRQRSVAPNRRLLCPLLAWLCLAACGLPCLGADEPWPRWRGRDGAGLGGAAEFPREWPDDAWAWKTDLPGKGHSSPVIWKGVIYTTAADEAKGLRFVMAHALADGRLAWQREIPGPIDPHHAQNSSATGSVAVDEAGIYWLWATRDGVRVEAFSHEGTPRWHADLGPFAGEHGFGGTPAVWHDLLIVSNDQEAGSSVVALECATGRERWRTPRQAAKTGYATPLVIDDPAAPLVVLTSMAHGFTGIDPRSGQVVWEQAAFPKRTVSSPVRVADLVLGTCGEGGGDNTLVALRLPGKDTAPAVAYRLDRSAAPYVPTPICVDGRLFLWGDRGVVTCVKAADGELLWRGRVGGAFSASPIAVGGAVLNVSADGEVVSIAAGDAFEVLGRQPLGEECRATPAVAGDRLVLRTAGRLLALDAKRP